MYLLMGNGELYGGLSISVIRKRWRCSCFGSMGELQHTHPTYPLCMAWFMYTIYIYIYYILPDKYLTSVIINFLCMIKWIIIIIWQLRHCNRLQKCVFPLPFCGFFAHHNFTKDLHEACGDLKYFSEMLLATSQCSHREVNAIANNMRSTIIGMSDINVDTPVQWRHHTLRERWQTLTKSGGCLIFLVLKNKPTGQQTLWHGCGFY